ncbi:MAG: hypothetical protein K1Y02_25490 [Candidatus Hydrogenedentes bacterium]|nr:hypothetical protein [Candidatus Hydrogenedentota bacterium]
MSEWTPDAREYLDGYLAQVRVLARQDGEDGDEIAAELREHIEREAEESSGSVVTLEQLRKVLATVGRPEQILSEGSLLARTNADTSSLGEDHSVPPFGADTRPVSQGNVQTAFPPERRTRRSGCWVILAGLFLFVLLGVAFWVFSANLQWNQMKNAKMYADERQVIQSLRDIFEGERRYLEEQAKDEDGDGVPDYATISELSKLQFIHFNYSQEAYGNYIFNLKLTHSAKTGTPSFLCEATPLFEEYPKSFTIDETGEVRITSTKGSSKRTVVPGEAEQLGMSSVTLRQEFRDRKP